MTPETPQRAYSASDLTWVKDHRESTDAEQLAFGRVRVRLLLQMRRPLPLTAPELAATKRVHLRSFQSGTDDSGLLRVNNRSFHWHPDQSGWDLPRLHRQTHEAGFDPAMLLIHEDAEEQIDGFCWTKIHPSTPEDPDLGEIYIIAADPTAHGTGLGRALTVGGLKLLSAHGLDVAMLFVEQENQAAIALYERLGFSVDHMESAYQPASSFR
ncbi:MAG: mycothiol synthase [Microthrixaceae bacterium]